MVIRVGVGGFGGSGTLHSDAISSEVHPASRSLAGTLSAQARGDEAALRIGPGAALRV